MEFVNKYICCCSKSDTESDKSKRGPLPTSGDSPDMPPRPVKNVYGKKTRKVVTAGHHAIFDSTAGESSRQPRQPLADITGTAGNFAHESAIEGAIESLQSLTIATDQAVRPTDSLAESSSVFDRSSSEDPNDVTADESAVEAVETVDAPALQYLKPITESYFKDRGAKLYLQSWDDILDQSFKVIKIAEASFAEVYRIENPAGRSILKVMNLKVPSDPASDLRERSILVESVVSEVRIMNALTVVPGFVTFKEAHLVQGTPPQAIIDAWNRSWLAAHRRGVESEFPLPSNYGKESVFLVIELGDAGTVLEDFQVTTGNEFIDVLFGVIIALARAEQDFKFEHRDLHENNVCFTKQDVIATGDSTSLFGRSGMSITIIDYGLSRAELNDGEVIFNDLENDLAIFRGSGTNTLENLQFQIYRTMRVYLLTGELRYEEKDWHHAIDSKESRELGIYPENVRGWDTYAPHSNALWVRYLFKWLVLSLKQHGPKGALRDLLKEIMDLQDTLMSLKRGTRKGKAFGSAVEILQFLLEKGWIEEEQLLGDGEEVSFLSENQ